MLKNYSTRFPIPAMAVTMLITFGLSLLAQTGGSIHTHHSAYWTTEYGQKSTIILRNSHRTDALTVSSMLYLSNGTEVALENINLGPQSNVSLDVQTILSARGLRSASGSARFEYRHSNSGILLAETIVANAATTVAYTIPSSEHLGDTRRLYALYWTPAPTTEFYVAVQNVSTSKLTVRPILQADEDSVVLPPIILEPHQSSVIELPEYGHDTRVRRLWSNTRSGAVVLTHDGPAAALNASAWLEDDHSGFSTSITLADPSLVASRSLFGTQMFLKDNGFGSAPAGSGNVQSHLLLKNTTDATVSLRGDLLIETSLGSNRVALPLASLRGGEFVAFALDELTRSVAGAKTASVRIDYDGPLGAIVGRSFGVSQRRTYGYYAALESAPYWAFNGILWSLQDGRNTLISVANFGESSDDVAVELFHSAGTAKFPAIKLGPNEVRTLDLRDLVRANGIQLPPDGGHGGYRISGIRFPESKLLTKAHVVDPSAQTAFAVYGGGGTYITNFVMYPQQISVTANGGTQSVEALLTWSDAYQEYRCDNMTTLSSSVATVSSSGCPRTLTGGYAGNTTTKAEIYGPAQGGGSQMFTAQSPTQVKWNVNLTVANASLTVNRSQGSINIIATATTTASQYTGNKSVTIGISAPANPSGIVLDSGAGGTSCNLSIAAGSGANCQLTVTTSTSNTTSGTLTYTVTLTGLDGDAVPTGSPKTVTVQTVP